MRLLRRIVQAAATFFAGVVVVCAVAYGVVLAAGYKPVAVYSGSMRPTLGVGSVAFDKVVPGAAVRVGNVVTFSDPYVKNRLVTHRIVRIFQTKHGLAYRTKGDANAQRDPWTIALPDHVGRMSFSVPYAGYVLWYAHTREIRTALIFLAAIALLWAILGRIWREDRREAHAA